MYGSIMCGYFCIGFINFLLKAKSSLEYTNIFSADEYEKNVKMQQLAPQTQNFYYLLIVFYFVYQLLQNYW